jgi:tRNA-dihydrouridine synthase
MGLTDDLLTYLRAGTVCEGEGVTWIALHARTAEQHYAGNARWDAIGELKAHVRSIPVLGNGDIWVADDALSMMAYTGCDGVVIGRGCLGRPWLFGDLIAAMSNASHDASEGAPASERSSAACVAGERNDVFAGRPAPSSRPLGDVIDVMAAHGRDLAAHHQNEFAAMRDFRKHTAWYFTGYPVGPEVRRNFSQVGSLAELDDMLARLDRTITVVDGGETIRRGHTNGPIRVSLPAGFLDDLDALEHDLTVPDDNDVMALSGG